MTKEISYLIGRKWFLSLEILAARSGVSASTISNALRGKDIGSVISVKLLNFLKDYKGECNAVNKN